MLGGYTGEETRLPFRLGPLSSPGPMILSIARESRSLPSFFILVAKYNRVRKLLLTFDEEEEK